MNIYWAVISRDLEISSKCSVEAIKNTTLSKGFSPMRSDADLPIKSLVLIFFLTHLLFQVLLWSHDFDNLYGRNSQVNIYGCCMHVIYAYIWIPYQPVSLFTGVKESRKESTMLLSWVINMVGCLSWFLLLLNCHFSNIYWHQIFINHRSFLKATEGWKDLDFKRSLFKKCLILSRTGGDLSRQLTATNIKNPCISELPHASVSKRGLVRSYW